MAYKVGVFIGSLSKNSINRKLAKALFRLAPESLELTEIPIKDLPLYNYDFDENYPPEGKAFKEAIARQWSLAARSSSFLPSSPRSPAGWFVSAAD